MSSNQSLATIKSLVKLLPKRWRTPLLLLATLAIIAWSLASHFSTPVTSVKSRDAVVTKVVDGDTIDVSIDGQKHRIRLIGIDTPEVVDPRKPVQCFGAEASKQTHALLDGQTVRLESDPTQDNQDKYGRWLRYVYLPDNQLVNLLLIQQGYAHEYTYQVPYQKQLQFKQAETEARNNEVGLWSPESCAGNTK
jgi:micrococcal nuclease